MSTLSLTRRPRGGSPAGVDAAATVSKPPIFDLGAIDLARRVVTREALERINPHRGAMALLDGIVWHEEDFSRGVASVAVRGDEFWVPGHFPGMPLMPGVMMIEAGAQLASFLYNSRFPDPKMPVFIRIEDASFRASVAPGDTLYLLCKDVKFTPKRFISDIQGLVGGRAAFEARITGMAVAPPNIGSGIG